MEVYDKAAWHIDAGMSKKKVVDHFKFIFSWLNDKEWLSRDGKEILEAGIDSSVSLSDLMVTKEGSKFLKKYYDKLVSKCEYNVTKEKKLIDEFYTEYTSKLENEQFSSFYQYLLW